MECSCAIDGYDTEPSDCSVGMKTLERKHDPGIKCTECCTEIKFTATYEYVECDLPRSTQKNTHQVYITCTDCLSLRDALFCTYTYSLIWDDLWAYIEESDIPESCISKLTPVARANVCKLIEDSWEEEEE